MGRIKKSIEKGSINIIEQLYNNSSDKELFIKLIRQSAGAVLTRDRLDFSVDMLKTEIPKLAELAKEIFGSDTDSSGGLKKSELRSIAIYYIRNKHKCSYTELGKPFGLTPSATLYGANLIEGFISVDEKYASRYSEFVSKADELMTIIHSQTKISKLKFTLIDDGNTDVTN